jgi:hypothetical protein
MSRLSAPHALALVLLTMIPAEASAYSVLAHEASIDVAWDGAIKPLILRRFPRTTPDQLVRARSFAYGGSVIQDLGYYPFGNKFFSNLVHYVRSGDFVEALIRDAGDADELAFALGALAHYANDTTGHPDAVNLSVPILFPKLHRKFGDTITYAQAPHQHVIVEFSFDVVQVAAGAYVPDGYKQLVGFRVATPLLGRAFRETYGLEMDEIFADTERAISTYRYSVSQIIPALTNAAWRDKHDEIVKLTPAVERNTFIFAYSRRDFERDYGRAYQKPRLFARFLGVLYRILPKIGPLKPLSFKAPTAEAEALFVRSFKEATGRFRTAVADVDSRRLEFKNTDFDTGRAPHHGEYSLADDTYVELLDRLSKHRFASVSSALKRDILGFYRGQTEPTPASKREKKQWIHVESALWELSQTAERE